MKLAYTVEEAADQLSIGRTTLYGLISAGQIKSIKIGGSRRVTLEALQEYIANLQWWAEFEARNAGGACVASVDAVKS